MPSQQSPQETLHEEANRLYWDSDESVNQIGEELGLSKGVLYGLIEPLPAGLPCPACGEEMVFPNRTARDRGFLVCSECGMEEEEATVQSYWAGAAEEGGDGGGMAPHSLARRAGSAVQTAVQTGRERVGRMGTRNRVIAGTALLGAAAGILLAGFFRRR